MGSTLTVSLLVRWIYGQMRFRCQAKNHGIGSRSQRQAQSFSVGFEHGAELLLHDLDRKRGNPLVVEAHGERKVTDNHPGCQLGAAGRSNLGRGGAWRASRCRQTVPGAWRLTRPYRKPERVVTTALLLTRP